MTEREGEKSPAPALKNPRTEKGSPVPSIGSMISIVTRTDPKIRMPLRRLRTRRK